MSKKVLADKPAESLCDNTKPVVDGESSPSKEWTEQRVSFIKDGQLVETVVSSGYFQFAVSGSKKLVDSVQHNGVRIEPPYHMRPMCETGLVRFPSGIAPYGSTTQLITDIKEFISGYANVPDEWLDIIPLYILMTWVYDRFTAVPYLRFLGEPGTGKTRLLIVSAAISYNAITASGNITGPALFRTIDLVRGTMAVDEADFKNSEEWSDITKVLNNGYTTGMPVVRCERMGSGFAPQALHVYGPKIICTRSRFADEALETRCLTLETREGSLPAHIPLQLPLLFEQEALVLRNKLLLWRFDHFHEVQAQEEGLRSLFPRSGQIGASLAAVAPNEESRKKVVDFLTRYDAGRRGDSDKGLVLQALDQLRATAGSTSPRVGDVARNASNIAGDLGLDALSPRRVGSILRSIGITPHRTKNGYVIELPKDEQYG